MADLALANSTYSTGTNDTASTLVNNVTATDAQQWNGVATAAVGIETVLGTSTDLKGTATDLVARLAILLQSSGLIKDKDSGTTYTKYDGWVGYGTNTLRKMANLAMPGDIKPWPFTTIPGGWLSLNAQQVSCTTFVDLFDLALPDLDTPGTTAVDWRRGTANHTLAQATDINTTTETLTKTAHGLSNGTVVHVSSSGTIPTGLVTKTKYYLVGVTTNTYQLSLTSGGAPVDITAVGSGTLSVYTTFQLPDWRGRSVIGAGTGSGLTNRVLNTAYGEENHTLTGPESGIAAHGHTEVAAAPGTAGPTTPAVTTSNYAANTATSTATTGPTTAADAHNVIHPVIAATWLVRH